MSGARSKKAAGKSKKQENKTLDEKRGKEATNDNTASMEESGSEKEDFTTVKAIQSLSKEVQSMKTELKWDLMDFKDDFKNDINRSLTTSEWR